MVCYIWFNGYSYYQLCVFEHSTDKFATDEDHEAFIQEQFDSLKFLYGDVTMKVCGSFIQVILKI